MPKRKVKPSPSSPSPHSSASTTTPLSWDTLESRRPHPLRFALFATRKPSANKANLTAALVAGNDPHTSITRLLDPEPRREPLVSLGAVFAYADVTIVDGLLRFGLRRESGDYDLTLAGYEPFDELWAPLAVARRIASELGVDKQLASILDWKTRHAWSLDEGDSGLIHNWRVPADSLDSSSYCTGALLEVAFRSIELLQPGTQVRTLVSNAQRAEVLEAGHRSHPTYIARRLEQNLLRLSVRAYEQFLEAVDAARAAASFASPAPEDDEASVENDLTTPPPPENSGEDDTDAADWPASLSKRTLLVILRDILQRRQHHSSLDNDGISLWEGRIRISATELLGAEPELGLAPHTSKAHRSRLVQARRQLAIAHLLTLASWTDRHALLEPPVVGDASVSVTSPTNSVKDEEQLCDRIASLEGTVKELSQNISTLLASSGRTSSNAAHLIGLEKHSRNATGMDAISSGGSSSGRTEGSPRMGGGGRGGLAPPTSPFEVLVYLGIMSLLIWVLRFN